MKIKGYLNSIIAAISYGTNPLFALPMFSSGLGVNSVLFYRYFFAVILYGLWLIFIKKISLKITKKQFLIIFCIAIFFSLSSLFLFDSFNYIDSGAACTILFSYPFMIALISKIFFKEKLPKIIWFAMLITILGISLLYFENGENINTKGVIFALLSGLAYAIYIVAVRQIKEIKHIKPDKLTFYVMFLGLSVYIWNLKFCTQLQPLNSPFIFICALMLAIFPTIISLETLTIGIRLIGAVKTAVLGALEPLTALFFGIILFGETLSIKIVCGIILILSGVIFVITAKNN